MLSRLFPWPDEPMMQFLNSLEAGQAIRLPSMLIGLKLPTSKFSFVGAALRRKNSERAKRIHLCRLVVFRQEPLPASVDAPKASSRV